MERYKYIKILVSIILLLTFSKIISQFLNGTFLHGAAIQYFVYYSKGNTWYTNKFLYLHSCYRINDMFRKESKKISKQRAPSIYLG